MTTTSSRRPVATITHTFKKDGTPDFSRFIVRQVQGDGLKRIVGQLHYEDLKFGPVWVVSPAEYIDLDEGHFDSLEEAYAYIALALS